MLTLPDFLAKTDYRFRHVLLVIQFFINIFTTFNDINDI